MQATSSTGDGASTLALKPMGGGSPKQSGSQNGDLSAQKLKKTLCQICLEMLSNVFFEKNK